MGRDLVGDGWRGIGVCHTRQECRSSVQPISLTSLNDVRRLGNGEIKNKDRYLINNRNLNKKELRLAGQSGTLVRGKVRPQLLRFILLVLGVEDPIVAMRHERYQDAVVIAVIFARHCLEIKIDSILFVWV